MIFLRPVQESDRAFLFSIDTDISESNFQKKVSSGLEYVICVDEIPVGFLHYCVLWDNLPFLNKIYLLEKYRGRGIGRCAMTLWEEEMGKCGFSMVLTSTQADESAQFFYRHLKYRDCGVLLLQDCPLEQAPELFLCKVLAPFGSR